MQESRGFAVGQTTRMITSEIKSAFNTVTAAYQKLIGTSEKGSREFEDARAVFRDDQAVSKALTTIYEYRALNEKGLNVGAALRRIIGDGQGSQSSELQNRAFSLSAPIGFRTSPDILLTKLEEAAKR